MPIEGRLTGAGLGKWEGGVDGPRSATLAASSGASDDQATEEASLVARAQRDPAAFTPLYARYARPVYRYCYRRLGSHEAAEDATSQTFAKALAGLPRYRHGSFRGWLFTIADRVVTDVYRRQRPQLGLHVAAELVDRAPGPEDRALADEDRRAVQVLLGRLPADQRRVVELGLAGLTVPEIARVLGRRPEAVKSTRFRAYARLRRLMAAPVRMEASDRDS